MRRALFPVVILLLTILSASSMVTGQENPPAKGLEVGGPSFPISGSLKGRNFEPAIAVNSLNGDVLVVWTNIEKVQDTEYSTIYAKRFRYVKGKFKAGKAKAISSDKADFNHYPAVAFNAITKTYFVTWSRYHPFIATSDIYGRKLNLKGSPVGAARPLVADEYSNQYSVIEIFKRDPLYNDQPDFLIFFDKHSVFWHAQDAAAGLYSIGVDAAGNEMWAPLMIDAAPGLLDSPGDVGVSRPAFVFRNSQDNFFYLTAVRETKYNSYSAWVYKCDSAALLSSKKQLAAAPSVPFGLVMLSDNLLLATYSIKDDQASLLYYSQKLRPSNLSFQGKAAKTLQTYTIDSRTNLTTIGGYANAITFGFSSTDSGFYSWDFTIKGKELPKSATKLFDFDGQLDEYEVHSLSETDPDIIVVWHKYISDGKGELWGNFVRAR